MEKKEIFEYLSILVEGKISPNNWINWWNSNLNEIEKNLPRTAFLKIKPNITHGETRATLISQHAAFEFLTKEGFVTQKSDIYKKEWTKEFEKKAYKRDNEDKLIREQFKVNFKALEIHFPKLYKCLGKYLTTHDKIIGGITDESIRKMASTLNYVFSHGLNTFFSVVSKIYLEGVKIDFEELREFEVNSERYIVLGEFWLENDGDMIMVKDGNDSIYYYNHAVKPNVKKLTKDFNTFVEKELTRYIKTVYEGQRG